MAQANPPPRRFGDFEIIERLGRGGFGTVYKARDTTLGGRIVALKILNADLAADPDWVRRFGREASIAANRPISTWTFLPIIVRRLSTTSGPSMGQTKSAKSLHLGDCPEGPLLKA